MFYGRGHEFPGFSQMIYWGPTRVSRVFQMVYWLASASRPIHHHISSLSNRPRRPGPYHPTRIPRHGSTTTTCPSPHGWAAACCTRPRPRARPPAPRPRPPPAPMARRAPPSTSRSTSARSTSGGHFSATLMPKYKLHHCSPGAEVIATAPRVRAEQLEAKRVRWLGGRLGSAISGRFRMVKWPGPSLSVPAPNIPYFWANSYLITVGRDCLHGCPWRIFFNCPRCPKFLF
jgi:hypothetical protein